MDSDSLTVGANVVLADGVLGVIVAIASDDEIQTVQANGPVSVRLRDQGQVIHVAYEQITDAWPSPSS